jgi:hypothetical protein
MTEESRQPEHQYSLYFAYTRLRELESDRNLAAPSMCAGSLLAARHTTGLNVVEGGGWG